MAQQMLTLLFGGLLAPAITGTGAVTIGGPSIAATGTATPPAITGTGAIAISGPSVTGAGFLGAAVLPPVGPRRYLVPQLRRVARLS